MCAYRQCTELGIGIYIAKLYSRDKYCTTASLIKVPSMKMNMYLILEFHNTLTDTTKVANGWRVKCKNY